MIVGAEHSDLPLTIHDRFSVLPIEDASGISLTMWEPRASQACRSKAAWAGILSSTSVPAAARPSSQASADALGAFAHAGDAPMAFAACLEHLGLDATAVVTNEDTPFLRPIFQLDFDVRRARMVERVDKASRPILELRLE